MFSLLRKVPEQEKKTDRPVFFQDLNIDQIIERITLNYDDEVKELYYSLPSNQDEEDYRRAVFQDVKKEGVLAILKEFEEHMQQRMVCITRKEKVENNIQKQVWYLREVKCYLDAVDCLMNQMNTFAFDSEGINALHQFLKQYTSSTVLCEIRKEATRLYEELSDFRLLITYEKDRFSISEGVGKGSYSEFMKKTLPGQQKDLQSPFISSFDSSDFEREAIKAFRKNHKTFFNELDQFCDKYNTYTMEDVLLLQKEMLYYIAYLQFIQKMQNTGMEFCTPIIEKDHLYATGLYDLALACASLAEKKNVVSNDFDLFKEENFLVLTGPNQGGKTTFARSLGQLIYFTKMGLDVPARSAGVPYYKLIMTHFSVEESTETGRGKLVDELMRLQPMMGEEQTEAFIIINELFTTAANYDACIMGKQVIEFFIENHCKGIYVTHLNELSKAHETVVSLRASVDENMIQTFKVTRSAAKDFTGVNRQVEKYNLTYQQIKQRFQ